MFLNKYITKEVDSLVMPTTSSGHIKTSKPTSITSISQNKNNMQKK